MPVKGTTRDMGNWVSLRSKEESTSKRRRSSMVFNVAEISSKLSSKKFPFVLLEKKKKAYMTFIRISSSSVMGLGQLFV